MTNTVSDLGGQRGGLTKGGLRNHVDLLSSLFRTPILNAINIRRNDANADERSYNGNTKM